MVKYKVIEDDLDTGLNVIKILSGVFDGLLLSLYNVGCNGDQMYYNYNIMNEKEDTNTEQLDEVIKQIVDNLYFKEC